MSETPELQGYVAGQLWRAVEQDTADRQPLTQVATWCIGEYGDVLLYGNSAATAEDPADVVQVHFAFRYPTSSAGCATKEWLLQVTEEEVLEVYQRLLWSPQNTVVTKQYALLSLTKLSTRFRSSTE